MRPDKKLYNNYDTHKTHAWGEGRKCWEMVVEWMHDMLLGPLFLLHIQPPYGTRRCTCVCKTGDWCPCVFGTEDKRSRPNQTEPAEVSHLGAGRDHRGGFAANRGHQRRFASYVSLRGAAKSAKYDFPAERARIHKLICWEELHLELY